MISIITPVRNGARFIEGCLRGVIEQGVPDLEHIVVDGASTDGTLTLIERYAAEHPHIRFVSAPDSGQSEALNRGIGMARGRILGVLNVDDYYEPGALRLVEERFRTLPEPALLVGNCNVRDEADEVVYVNRPARLTLPDLLLREYDNPNIPLNPSAYFYHRSLHDRIGGFDPADHYVMDIDLVLRAVEQAHVVRVDRTLGNFRLIPGSKTFGALGTEAFERQYHELLRRHRARLSPRQHLEVCLKTAGLKLRRWVGVVWRWRRYYNR